MRRADVNSDLVNIIGLTRNARRMGRRFDGFGLFD